MELNRALKTFGLSDKEQQVYLALTKHSWITALELSRRCPIKRTTLYRILESLTKKGLVEVQIGDKTTHYNAADPKQFESLVLEQEKKAKELRSSLNILQQSIQSISTLKPKETSVRFYRGIRGLKQLEWKKCENENGSVYIFDAGDLWFEHVGREFAEKIREEMVSKNITIYELFSKEKAEPIPSNGKASWTDNTAYVLNHYRGRAIPSELIKLTQDIYVLTNSVHLHGYKENDIFGIEILSPDFVSLMQHIFIYIWNQAETIDKFGGKNFKSK